MPDAAITDSDRSRSFLDRTFRLGIVRRKVRAIQGKLLAAKCARWSGALLVAALLLGPASAYADLAPLTHDAYIDAVSPNVSGGMVFLSFIGFTLLYGALMVADIYLLAKYAKGEADISEGAFSLAGVE